MVNFTLYKNIIRPLLFFYESERAHRIVCNFIKFLSKLPFAKKVLQRYYHIKDKRLQRHLWGVTFPNPVGLAAGFDKNAEMANDLAMFGFGFIEIGTITPYSQEGNPKPRLFRLPKDKALINRMGFNNKGTADIKKRLRRDKRETVIGINIGKNKNTPNQTATLAYKHCFEAFYEVADYIAINVSSPNTPHLRAMQHKAYLKDLLEEIMVLNKKKPNLKPILLKIAPDLSYEQLDEIIEVVRETGIAGIIATNTTVKRDNLKTNTQKIKKIGRGGLSGQPLSNLSTEVIRYISEKSDKAFPIIATGGIMSAEDAIEKLEAGASLVQVYTGLIYEGPLLVKQINQAILKKYY